MRTVYISPTTRPRRARARARQCILVLFVLVLVLVAVAISPMCGCVDSVEIDTAANMTCWWGSTPVCSTELRISGECADFGLDGSWALCREGSDPRVRCHVSTST